MNRSDRRPAGRHLAGACAWLLAVSCPVARAEDGVVPPPTFEACTSCHTYQRDEPMQEGPPLWGVVGRRTASVDGFDYSPALKAFGGSWDRARLDRFLANPKAAVPGTYMKLGGVADAAERAQVLDFLERISPPVDAAAPR
jgi:cytochrome c